MGLSKALPSLIGVDAEYWSVDPQINIDVKHKFCSITVNGYISKNAKDAGSSPITNRGFGISNLPATEDEPARDNFDDYLSQDVLSEPRPGLYNFIKDQPEFSGAKDC